MSRRQFLADYQRVLYKPKLKFDPRRVEAVLLDIGRASISLHPARILSDAKHEPDNRFLECAETAGAEFLVTGNKRHFPNGWKPSKIVNAREFITDTGLLDPQDT